MGEVQRLIRRTVTALETYTNDRAAAQAERALATPEASR